MTYRTKFSVLDSSRLIGTFQSNPMDSLFRKEIPCSLTIQHLIETL